MCVFSSSIFLGAGRGARVVKKYLFCMSVKGVISYLFEFGLFSFAIYLSSLGKIYSKCIRFKLTDFTFLLEHILLILCFVDGCPALCAGSEGEPWYES